MLDEAEPDDPNPGWFQRFRTRGLWPLALLVIGFLGATTLLLALRDDGAPAPTAPAIGPAVASAVATALNKPAV
jgi:hypothetical protein